MAFNEAAMNAAGTALAALVTHVSLHTAGDVTSSSSESTAGREEVTWTVATNGSLTAGPVSFTGGEVSGDVVRVGYWSAATGGTYYGGSLLTGDASFNASGEYTVNSITETASAS